MVRQIILTKYMDRKTRALGLGICHLAFMLVTVSQQQSFDPCLDNDLSKVFDGRPFGPLRSERPQAVFYHASNMHSKDVLKRRYLPPLRALNSPPAHTTGSSTNKLTLSKKTSCAPSNRMPLHSVPIKTMPFSAKNYTRPIITFIYRPATKDVSSTRVNYSYPSRFAKIPSSTSKPFLAIKSSSLVPLDPTLRTPFTPRTYEYLPPVGTTSKNQSSFNYTKPKPTYRPNVYSVPVSTSPAFFNQGAGSYVNNKPIKFENALPQIYQQALIPSLTVLPPHPNITSESLPSSKNISISSIPGTKNSYSFASPEFRIPSSGHRVPPTYLPPFPTMPTPVRYTTQSIPSKTYTAPSTEFTTVALTMKPTPQPPLPTYKPPETYTTYRTTPLTRPTFRTTTTPPPPIRTRPSVISVATVKTEGPLTAHSTAKPESKMVTNPGSTR